MKLFIYRLAALLWLLTHPEDDMNFPVESIGRWCCIPPDGDHRTLNFIEVLDYVIEWKLPKD